MHLIMLGLEAVPEAWATAVFDMLSQLVRNSIEHGIEPKDVRRRRGKSAEGTLLVEFRPRPDGGYELKYQDDGSGVDSEGVRDSAIRQHAVDPHAAQQASDRQLASLILLPGVTTARHPDGRGQGLKIVRDQARRLGGTIKVASKRGRFLRFSVDFNPKE
ncbi:MAG: ATP-binding protein [Steroidobacteraceae bacterium]